jgi:hypothetical protein
MMKASSSVTSTTRAGIAVAAHTAAQLGNGFFSTAHDLGVQLPQTPVDLQKLGAARAVAAPAFSPGLLSSIDKFGAPLDINDQSD